VYAAVAMCSEICEICVEVYLKFQDFETCNAVLKAVSIDDVELPEGQRVERRECRDDTLVYTICCRVQTAEDVLSLWNTIDDLVRSIRAASETLGKVK